MLDKNYTYMKILIQFLEKISFFKEFFYSKVIIQYIKY